MSKTGELSRERILELTGYIPWAGPGFCEIAPDELLPLCRLALRGLEADRLASAIEEHMKWSHSNIYNAKTGEFVKTLYKDDLIREALEAYRLATIPARDEP